MERTTVSGARQGVLERVVLLLDCFDENNERLTLADLCRSTDMPKSTVHRLTAALVGHALLAYDGPYYLLGPRLFELGGLVADKRSLRELALPYLEDLYVATKAVIHLAVIDGTDAVYVEKIRGHSSTGMVRTRPGYRVPLHASALGKALLANAAPTVLEAVLEKGLRPRGPRTIVSPKVLKDALEDIRRRGIAIEVEEGRRNVACVASSVFSDDHGVAAVSVAVPVHALDVERLGPCVQTTARGISRAIASSHFMAVTQNS